MFKGLRSEWKKITWPTAKEVAQKTGIVILVSAILGVVIGIYDWCFSKLLTLVTTAVESAANATGSAE